MSAGPGSALASLVRRFLPRLRYPYLFVILAALLLVDLVVPDPVPLADELILAVLTLLSATLTTRRDHPPDRGDREPEESAPPAPSDVLPPGDE